jgi:Peptidase family M28
VDAAGRTELIRELCSFEGRGPGTDAERRAANMLAERLGAMGRRVELEPTYVRPQWPLASAVHASIAIIGSVLATAEPAAGFALVLFAATSIYLDLNTRLQLVRSLFFRRASQNVLSPGPRPDAPLRLILVAHYDAGRSGYVFGKLSGRLARRLSERARLLLGPFRLLFWGGLAPLLPILGLRMAGVDATWLGALQSVPTILLIVSIFLLLDIALSGIVPGAYDNASGAATVLSVAEELDAEPPANLDVWVLLTGAEEGYLEGMRAFARARRKQLDRERTVIVNVDHASYGSVHYEIAEGAVISYRMDPQLIELCEALSESDPAYAARPLRSPLLTDALAARVRGFRPISVSTLDDGLPPPWYHQPEDTPERVDEEALARATDFVVALARLLDRDAGRRAPAPTAQAPEAPAPR